MMNLALATLSASYDWFFSAYNMYHNPPGSQLYRYGEYGLAHLFAAFLFNAVFFHFYLIRRFLHGMPWYDFHSHGVSLPALQICIYLCPNMAQLFQSKLFMMDIFNIHFGTPSKMNEVISVIGGMGLLIDAPQFVLKYIIFGKYGDAAPKVARVSMGLSVYSALLAIKRIYVARMERQWYMGIVQMAGVRRLTTYGGASQWLGFKKKKSALKD